MESTEDRETQKRIQAAAARSMDLTWRELGKVREAEARHTNGEEVRGRLGILFSQQDK